MGAGGTEMTRMMAKVIEPVLKATSTSTSTSTSSCRMLDVGFGVGGTAFEFCELYGATVTGIDVNPTGVQLANEELKKRNAQLAATGKPQLNVTFHVQDASQAIYEEGSFDVIYSRDALLHLNAATKEQLFRQFTKWLAPGGMVCIGDYCLGNKSHDGTGLPTPEFQEYLTTRGYHMWTPEMYAKTLEDAGLEQGVGRDLAFWYCATCQKELDRVLLPGPTREEFLKSNNEETLNGLETTYRNKIQMTLRGDRSYTLVTAVKKAKYMDLRQQVVDAYIQLSKENLIMSCDGNISARCGADDATATHFLVTPTGIDISDLEACKIVLCDHNGKGVPGQTFKPTSEKDLHTLIYQARPDVGAIVHSHSIYACALACCRMSLPPAHYAVCELLCNTTTSTCSSLPSEAAAVQCAPYHTYGTWALAVATLNALGKNEAVFMANHGAVVVGPDLETAMYRTARLERECEIYWRAKQLGIPQNLTLPEIQQLHVRDQTYGQTPEVVDIEGEVEGKVVEEVATETETESS
jgi:L-fuculose-phosphate aldolase